MLDLCCCGISVASLSRGYFLLLCAGFSLRWLSCGRAWTLGAGFSSCGTQAWLPHSMRDLPRPGMEPMSPALAGRFLTTGPPGKPENQLFNNIQQKNSPAKEYLLAWYTISFLSSPPLSPSKELFDQPSGSHLSVVLCALPFKALYTQQQEWVFKSTNPAYHSSAQNWSVFSLLRGRAAINSLKDPAQYLSLSHYSLPSLPWQVLCLLFLLLEMHFPQISAMPSFNFSSLSFMATSLVTHLPGYVSKSNIYPILYLPSFLYCSP